MNSPRRFFLYLICILAMAAGLRSLALGKPYLGNFTSYQLGMGSMARSMVREHFSDLLRPKLDEIVNGQPGILLHYYPVASLLVALGTVAFGCSMEILGRLQAIFFSLGTILLIYGIGARVRSARFGLIASAVYAFAPISVMYGQSFMNEAAGVFFVVLALYAFIRGRRTGAAWVICGIASAGLALVTRLNGFYVFVPLTVLWLCDGEHSGMSRLRSWLLICVCAGFLPLLWYGYTYVAAMHESHVYNCMFPQLGRQGPSALNGQFFKVGLRTIATVDCTPIGLILLIAGLIMGLPGKENRWLAAWFFAVLGSFALIPQKILDHNFYTLHLMPPASFFIAVAIERAWEKMQRWLVVLVLGLAVGWSARYFYHPVVKSVLEENCGVLEAAQAVQRMTPADARIIAARGSSNCLLCYSDRRGWAFMVTPVKEVPYQDLFRWRFKSPQEVKQLSADFLDPIAWLEHLRAEGAGFFVVASSKELDQNQTFKAHLISRYPRISRQQDGFLLYDLRH